MQSDFCEGWNDQGKKEMRREEIVLVEVCELKEARQTDGFTD